MSLSEFDVIKQFFTGLTDARDDVVAGIGDDCALLDVPPGRHLAVSVDTLVAGRHFLADADPESVGHKALAVNLSDLAAAGAEPAWATLALTLPAVDTDWLRGFSRGFAALAGRHGVALVGGDTTGGPLSITVTVHGFVAVDRVLTRGGARPGDRVCVSGTVGDAALALARRLRGEAVPAELAVRLDRPLPRVALGRLLGGTASAAIDVSDGLLADLGHVCARSGVGARVERDRIPLSPALATYCRGGDWSPVLGGGDDYELLCCVPPEQLPALRVACDDAGEHLTEIGELVERPGIVLVTPDGDQPVDPGAGFDHFRGAAAPR
jgi:thiamine-monophosphate kinase